MNFLEARDYLKALINRKDITPALASQFIRQSQARLERLVRLPFMERSSAAPAPDGTYALPADFLELIEVYGGVRELVQVDTAQFLQASTSYGIPTVFVRQKGTLKMRPIPDATASFTIRYYGSEPVLAVDTSENGWTTLGFEALIYGAAELACDFYEDERLQRFSSKFLQSVEELQSQAVDDRLAGPLSIAPAYRYPSD